MTCRLLITNAGTGATGNLMRSLVQTRSDLFLVGCHSDRFLLKKSPANRNFLIPPFGEGSAGEPAFERVLRTILRQERIDVTIPGNDRDARALAAIHEREPLSCRTLLPAARTIDGCQDKCELSLYLRERGIPAPRTYALTDALSVREAWDALQPRDLAWCRIRRGFASRGATKVRDPEQAWAWISYWHVMRGVPVEEFTLCEFLPGRDYNVQAVYLRGRTVLMKMSERLSYLNADQHASGMASTPAVAKTVWIPAAFDACEAALRSLEPEISGVFSIDLKENESGVPCITEINAGRFAMITSLYDLTPRYSMADTYLRLAVGDPVDIDDARENPGEYYLLRELDTLPSVMHRDELFEGVERIRPVTEMA
jgi:carbamoyl-phosphate synthase large subunit